MKWRDFLKKWGMSSLKLKVPFLEMEFRPSESDRNAAWELYVELLTRTATQPLRDEDGDEATALKSVFSLFQLTRDILKKNTSTCNEFAKIAIVVLNQVIRPFTAKWHRESLKKAFDNDLACKNFREELKVLQGELTKYMKLLADMAMVEDLTSIEDI